MGNYEREVTIIDANGSDSYMGTTNDERLLAMLIYLTSFFTTIVGPLLIWLFKRNESAFIDFHGKNYFNFIISYFIYGIVVTILMFIGIGFLLIPVVAIAAFVFTILAAVRSYNGEMYRIPFIFKIL